MCARYECFLMTKPSRALSLAAFVEVHERVAEDQDDQPMRPSCAKWRLRDGALWGWFVLWVKDPEQEVSGRAHGHVVFSWFEWVVEVAGPVAFMLSLLQRGGSAQVYVCVICITVSVSRYVFVVGATYRILFALGMR